MYVPINSSSKLIQNHNLLKSTCILFNTKRGKELLLTFEPFSVKRLDQCCLYFQIWYFNKLYFICSTLALFMLVQLDTLNQVFTFRIKLEFFQSVSADRSVFSVMNVLCWYREQMFTDETPICDTYNPSQSR